jgi:Lon protease-like protein
MFPLGVVLVPGELLPLHVFEERYRELMSDVLGDDGEFGVVLIERGSEVGGGDTRSRVGTMVRVVQAEELPDGRWAVVAVGDRRIRVKEWLSDDPYPRAVVEDWPGEAAPDVDLHSRYETVVWTLRTALGLAGELGREVAPVDSPLPEEPDPGSFALVTLAPLGPLDRQRLLNAPGTAQRLDLLEITLAEQIEALRAELRMGNG